MKRICGSSGTASIPVYSHSDISVTLNTYTHLGLEDAADELSGLKEIENARNEQAKLSGENSVFTPRIRIG